MIIKKITSFLNKYELKNCSIAIAVSGGADSIALLYALYALKDDFGLSLSVAHVNYNLRGEESQREFLYVQESAASLRLPLFYKEVQGLSLYDSSLEREARDIRYSFFEELKREKQIDFVAVAHTENDQAETLLFRLIRGTGLKGAGAMLPVRDDFYVRPLLFVSRTEVEQWLEEKSISWYNDSSNSDNHYSRNKIRNQVVPTLTEINQEAVSHIAAFTERVQCLQAALEESFKEWLASSVIYESPLSLVISTKNATPFLSDFIAMILEKRSITVQSAHVESLLTYWRKAGKELLLSKGYHAITLGSMIIFKVKESDEFSFDEKQLQHHESDSLAISPLFTIHKKDIPHGTFSLRMLRECDTLIVKRKTMSISVNKKLKKAGVPLWLRKRYPVYINEIGDILGYFNLKKYLLK